MKTMFPKNLEIGGAIFILVFAESIEMPRWGEITISIVNYVFIFFVIIGRWKRLTYVATRDISLVLLVVLAAVSILWSESPSGTAAYIKLLIRSTIFGVYLAAQYTPREQMRLLSWTTAIVMIMCLAVALFFPSQNIQPINNGFAWEGIFGHKQTFGRYMSFAATIFMINYFGKLSNQWVALAGLALALVLILLSTSKTSLLLFLFSLSLMPVYKITQQQKYRVFMLSAVLIIFIAIAILITVNLETIVVGFLGKNLELNGRTPLWLLSIAQGLERPWLGYGYNGFWTADISDYILEHTWAAETPGFRDHSVMFHAHNGYIDLFLQLGLLGCVLFVINVFLLLNRIIYLNASDISTRSIEYLFMLQFTGLLLIDNLSNSMTWLSSYNIYWIMYVSIVFSSAIECSRIKRNHYLSAYLGKQSQNADLKA